MKGIITSYYGERENPLAEGTAVHNGIDIGVPLDTPIYAVADGTVTQTGSSESWGVYVKYTTSDNRDIIYAHLNSSLVEAGAKVTRGQIMALSGNSGASTGPHLHFGVYENGVAVNPLSVTKEVEYS